MKVRAWICAVGAKAAFIAPGSLWEKRCCKSFNSRLRDELINGEALNTMREAQFLVVWWRNNCNTVRPHGSLGCRRPGTRGLPTSGSEDYAPRIDPDHSLGAGHGIDCGALLSADCPILNIVLQSFDSRTGGPFNQSAEGFPLTSL